MFSEMMKISSRRKRGKDYNRLSRDEEIISTVDESVDSRYSRRIASWRWSWNEEKRKESMRRRTGDQQKKRSAKRSDVVEEEIQQDATVHQQDAIWRVQSEDQQMHLKITKRCRSNKLERQRFVFAKKISRWSVLMKTTSRMIFAKNQQMHSFKSDPVAVMKKNQQRSS
ncbi:hypothetical protein F511_42040 [Dorcoceras hygrometricum]|uniref:Uncharacterized protein n=1 Tax=Dorcoceras hygrometricum TaxID=472368 RepID=A0A2Z7AN38_9LAMI|nr:hypothetical protein F511_42040 [Dorcoceras hygrometricum]